MSEKLLKKLEDMLPAVESVEAQMEGDEQYMAKDGGKISLVTVDPDVKQLDVVPAFALSLEQAEERIKMLQAFIKEYMVPGHDYGLIPGCKKPSLLKPGAEKLCDIYGFSKKAEVTNRVENWEKGIFAYEVKVILTSKRTEHIEAEGLGSCNSKEKKYASQNAYTICNTLLKMAKKRALVDAVLSATRSSGIFSQDLEDFDTGQINTHSGNSKDDIPKPDPVPATKEQLDKIYGLACKASLAAEEAKKLLWKCYKVKDSKSLSRSQAEDFIVKLTERASK